MNFKLEIATINRLRFIMISFFLIGCMKDDNWVKDHMQQKNIEIPSAAVFIVNEGNFMYGNATLSSLDTISNIVQNDIFYKINGLPLGDVAESMTIWRNKGYIVVNNSGKVYVIDPLSGKYIGKITGLTSPRFIHFVDETKAYITDLYAGQIAIVNPATNLITGSIACPSHRSTEEMVQYNNLVFVSCWSSDQTVLVIDTNVDKIIAEIQTGIQPCGIVLDKYGKIWVLCQSLPASSTKFSAQLQRIDPSTKTIEKSFTFQLAEKPVKLVIDGAGENLFFLLGNNIHKMSVLATQLPEKPFLFMQSKLLYGLGIDPSNGNIYVSDALDYQQAGLISRFSASGTLLGSFKAGIIPGRFCFRK